MSNAPSQFRIDVRDGVYLSGLEAGDQAAIIEFANDRDIYDNTLRVPYPYSKTDADAFIDIATKPTTKHGHPTHFAIRGDDDRLIGVCGMDGLVYGHRAEIGYWLGKPYRGRGIMTEVVRSVCEFAFDEWQLVRIAAYVFVQNPASARVLEKAGFTLEGILRKQHQKDGNFIDAKLYALVR